MCDTYLSSPLCITNHLLANNLITGCTHFVHPMYTVCDRVAILPPHVHEVSSPAIHLYKPSVTPIAPFKQVELWFKRVMNTMFYLLRLCINLLKLTYVNLSQ